MAAERIKASQAGTLYRSADKVVESSTRGRGLRRWPVLSVVVLGVALWPMVAWLGAKLLIVKFDLSNADAIVVLSGSSTYVERVDWAARLYREGRGPIILLTNDGVISGWNHAQQRNPYFYELAVKELQERGVPASKIQIVPEIASGTYEESLEVRDYASAHKLKRLLVVTSAYHSRRALSTLRRACEGTDIEVGIEGPPPGWQTPWPATWWLHRFGWKVVAGEYVKMIYYWMSY